MSVRRAGTWVVFALHEGGEYAVRADRVLSIRRLGVTSDPQAIAHGKVLVHVEEHRASTDAGRVRVLEVAGTDVDEIAREVAKAQRR